MVMLCNEIFKNDLEIYENTGKFISQTKADGDNFQIFCEDGKVTNLINRHENNYTRQFPDIVGGFGLKEGITAVFNAEISYWDNQRKIFDFNAFRSREGLQKDMDISRRSKITPCKAYIFDLISYNGISMIDNPDYPFSERYRILQSIIIDNEATELLPIRKDMIAHFKEECATNREGIVVKSIDNIYSKGRSKSILKCKNWKYDKIKFTGFEDCPSGIVLTNGKDRVLCSSRKYAELIRATIIQQGYTEEIVRHLQDRTKNGSLREPSWKEKAKFKYMVVIP